MQVKLSPKMQKQIPVSVKEYGYKSKREFIEDAFRRRILELKKFEFLSGVKKIQKAVRKKRINKEDILKDFEKFNY